MTIKAISIISAPCLVRSLLLFISQFFPQEKGGPKWNTPLVQDFENSPLTMMSTEHESGSSFLMLMHGMFGMGSKVKGVDVEEDIVEVIDTGVEICSNLIGTGDEELEGLLEAKAIEAAVGAGISNTRVDCC